MTQMEYTFI